MKTTTKQVPVRKKILDRLDGGYALLLDRIAGRDSVFVGSESKGGESRLISLDGDHVVTATKEVGGMMHILPAPGMPGSYVAAMGMYAPFIGQGAAVYMLRAGSGFEDTWNVSKLFDMPFVHRLGFVDVAGRPHMLIATVSVNKENPDDWSKPGELYAVDFQRANESGEWSLKRVSAGIFRNHGMWVGPVDGTRSLLVSGAEGMFSVRPDSSAESGFELLPVLEEEISEMVPVDLDGDGQDEFVVIEPFHGHRLRVYKRGVSGAWNVVWETTDLSFGHGLNVIPCGSRKLVVVGNRRDGKELLGFDFGGLSGSVKRFVFDEGVGPTQIEPFSDGKDGIARFVSCNQGSGEITRYEVSEQEIAR